MGLSDWPCFAQGMICYIIGGVEVLFRQWYIWYCWFPSPSFCSIFFYKHPFILIKMLFLNFRFIYRLIISHYNLDHNQTMNIPLSYIAFAGYIIKEMNEISFLFNMIISNDGWYFGPIQDAIIKIQPSCNTEHKQTSKQKN